MTGTMLVVKGGTVWKGFRLVTAIRRAITGEDDSDDPTQPWLQSGHLPRTFGPRRARRVTLPLPLPPPGDGGSNPGR